MVRPHPRLTLFPYTTLFRSDPDRGQAAASRRGPAAGPGGGRGSHRAPHPADTRGGARPAARSRSEEHTSELQSLRHLVCRPLLEKKKIAAAPPEFPLLT